MNNAAFFICFVLCIAFAVAIPWAIRNDNAEAHLLHGPSDGCLECGK
jgi:hypothetical protein